MRNFIVKLSCLHLTICLFVANIFVVNAQSRSVQGVIIDGQTNEPLTGASVVIKGSTAGTTTDVDGKFSLSVNDENVTLIISFIGYVRQEIPLQGRTFLQIAMISDEELLDEVVVIGYGTVRKSDLTGAVASVKAKDLSAYPVTNVMRAMAGRIPGVFVQQTNASPGGGVQVRIRGTNSISGDNNPLYVIDGFLYNGTPLILQPGDIESMEVLKDASATAIYGSRGANGVVLITTKKGKSGKTKVEFETGYTVQSPLKKMDLMNAAEYAEFTNAWLVSQNKQPYFDNPASLGEGTDWQDLVLHNAPVSNTLLNISGGNDKTQFSMGAGYYDEQGIVKNSKYSRMNVHSNINHEISRIFSVSANLTYAQNYMNSKNMGGGNRGDGLFGALLVAPPTLTPYNDDGSTYRNLQSAYPFSSNVLKNPVEYLYEVDNLTLADKLLGNAALIVKPIEGLVFKFSGGMDMGNNRYDNYNTTKQVFGDGSASVSTERYQSLLSENTVSYSKKAGVHDISAVAG
ncbi:MAG: SusC/RagA family TonB-linked outer membrane protein, partial [Tannerella sp.]|nr:SusC/RagA family TonB-linked outer membrane protein [Tannerella sp.]